MLWALASPSKLPARLRAELTDPAHDVFASAASTWEIAIKAGLGKIDVDLDDLITATDAAAFVELPIRMVHTARVRDLPALHRDPFDRLLVAQAFEEGLTVVTRDAIFDRYQVVRRWG